MATRKQRKGEGGAGPHYPLHEHGHSDLLPPTRPHFLRFLSPLTSGTNWGAGIQHRDFGGKLQTQMTNSSGGITAARPPR